MNPRRILIVDDDLGITHICRLILEGTGRFVVREVNRGLQALPAACEFQPDLIMLDSELPDKNGSSIARDLKMDPRTTDMPILFMTGSIRSEDAALGLLGFPVLAKPMRGDELVLAAGLMLAGRAARSSPRKLPSHANS